MADIVIVKSKFLFSLIKSIQCVLKYQLLRYEYKDLEKVEWSESDKQNALKDYIEIVGVLGKWNGANDHWWATDIASKNRFTSPLLGSISECLKSIRILELSEADQFCSILTGLNWPAIKGLKAYAKKKEYKIIVIQWPFQNIIWQWHSKVKAWKNLLLTLLTFLKQKIETAKSFRLPIDISPSTPVVLIKSFVYQASLKNGFKDPFFGRLPDLIESRFATGFEILTIVLGFADRQECYRKIRNNGKNKLLPFENTLSYKDVIIEWLIVVKNLVFRPFQVRGKLMFGSMDVSPIVKELFKSGGWYIPFVQYLHLKSAHNLAKRYNIRTCFLTYENNPWERMFIKGFRDTGKGIKIAGYQHSVVPEAAAGMFISDQEIGRLPIPDTILTTGSIPADIIRGFSSAGISNVEPAGALRYEYLHVIEPVKRKNKGKRFRLLVALEGVLETVGLFTYALEQASRNESIDFYIRTHPALPFEELVLITGIKRDTIQNVIISKESSLISDIESCDAILYWGTTVALEGLMMGKPVIHFDRGDLISYDPLFGLNDFKWIVKGQQNIDSIIHEIETMSETNYRDLQNKAREYVLNYFHPVEKQNLKVFTNLIAA